MLLLLPFKITADTLNPDGKYDEDDDNAELSEEEADADGDATGEKNKQKREQFRISILSIVGRILMEERTCRLLQIYFSIPCKRLCPV